LFAYLIKEDVQIVLLLLARKPWGTGIILWSRAVVSTLVGSHFGLPWSWSKSHQRLLSLCSAGTPYSICYQKSGPRRLFYFSAGQCVSPQSRRNHRLAKKRQTRLHSSHIYGLRAAKIWILLIIKCGAWWN